MKQSSKHVSDRKVIGERGLQLVLMPEALRIIPLVVDGEYGCDHTHDLHDQT